MYHIICKNYTKLKRLVFFTTCFKPLLGWKSHIHVHGKRGWNNRRGLSVSFHHFSNDRLGWQQGVCCTPPSKEVLLKPERCWSLSNYSGIPPHFLSLSPWSVCRLFSPPAHLFPSLSLSVCVKEAQLTLASLLRREKSSSHPHSQQGPHVLERRWNSSKASTFFVAADFQNGSHGRICRNVSTREWVGMSDTLCKCLKDYLRPRHFMCISTACWNIWMEVVLISGSGSRRPFSTANNNRGLHSTTAFALPLPYSSSPLCPYLAHPLFFSHPTPPTPLDPSIF